MTFDLLPLTGSKADIGIALHVRSLAFENCYPHVKDSQKLVDTLNTELNAKWWKDRIMLSSQAIVQQLVRRKAQ